MPSEARRREHRCIAPESLSDVVTARNTPREILLCDTEGGPILVFASDSVIGRSVATRGHFGEAKIDEVVSALLRHDLRPRRFIDIGANIGTHILYALGSGQFRQAIAIEADPDNFLLLRANVALRGLGERATLIHCALSSAIGVAELELCPSNFGDHRVRVPSIVHARDLGETMRQTRRVPADTADNLLNASPSVWRETLVWMDTQGHEGHILGGARESLCAWAPAVVMEFWPYGLQRAGGKQAYFEFLAGATTIYDVNRPAWITQGQVSVPELLETYERMLQETRADYHPHTDLLCIRPAAAMPGAAADAPHDLTGERS
jgi:FkbM family methyltransferase